MRNIKAKSGIAQLMFGAALLISGPSLQTQIDRIASDPQVQLAKVMLQGLVRGVKADMKAVQAEVLAESTPAPALQFDSAVAPAEAASAKVNRAASTTVAMTPAPPQAPMVAGVNVTPAVPSMPRLEMATFVNMKGGKFPGLTHEQVQELKARIDNARLRALEATKNATEVRRVVMLRAEATAEKCSKTEVKTNI